MRETIFRAKLEADEGLDDLFESVADTSSEYAQELKAEIDSLKARLAKLEKAHKVYQGFAKMGLEYRRDIGKATYEAALKEIKAGNNAIGVKLLEDAGKNGSFSARIALAKAKIYGLYGVKRAPKEGLAMLMKEAEEDKGEACLLITEIRKDYPRLVSPDLALDMCQKAVALGYEPALERINQPFDMSEETKRLLARYKKGEKGVAFWLSTRGDLPSEKRMRFFEESVKEGDPMAEFEMGSTLLREGDEKGAREFFEKAVEHGHGPACYSLIRMILKGRPHFYRGQSVPDRNDPVYQEELRLVKRAAEIGYTRGLVALGRAYVRGYMVDQDYEAAKPLLEKALFQGERDSAPQLLGEIYQNSQGEGTAAKAVEYYEIAATSGNIAAMMALRDIYEKGLREIPKDPAKAMYYAFLSRNDRW